MCGHAYWVIAGAEQSWHQCPRPPWRHDSIAAILAVVPAPGHVRSVGAYGSLGGKRHTEFVGEGGSRSTRAWLAYMKQMGFGDLIGDLAAAALKPGKTALHWVRSRTLPAAVSASEYSAVLAHAYWTLL